MICKLCLQEKKLLKKSHIIPDFMYNGIYDTNHQILKIKYPNFANYKRVPTGDYDKYILCQNCDNVIIGELESYSSQVLNYGNRPKKKDLLLQHTKNADGQIVLIVDNVDYRKFKLFLLSILWRASVSSNLYYKEISLGVHEERIRQAIFLGNPLDETDYQVCIMVVKINDILSRDFILNPIKISQKDNPSFCFYINGAFFFYSTERNSKEEIFYRGAITKANRIEIPLLELKSMKALLNKFWDMKLI